MERLGTFADARIKVLADVERLLSTVQRVAATPIAEVEAGIAVLKELRAETYEDLNQIQHEFMIVRAAEWLVTQNRVPSETLWSWNPRQTGLADEPDLRGEHNGAIILSAEITTSTEPKGLIDSRMRTTLEKLSNMDGERFYFTASEAMCQRARTKIRKAGWQIQTVHLPARSAIGGIAQRVAGTH
jgi:hypothetical protein